MSGKIVAGLIVVVALLSGAAIYYLQVWGFYREVPASGPRDVMIVALDIGEPVPLAHERFRAIDADSSPIRFRACFDTALTLDQAKDRFQAAPGNDPRTAPGWFSCFDAQEIGKALEEGRAMTFLGQKNVAYGVDRIVAITDDGRGFAWNELNDCGRKAYDGTVTGEACPPRPESGN